MYKKLWRNRAYVWPFSRWIKQNITNENSIEKIKPQNKLGVSAHSCYDCKSTNHNYYNYQKPQHCSKDYNISRPRKTHILFVSSPIKRVHKSNAEMKVEEIFVRILKLIQKAKHISLLKDMILFQTKIICWLIVELPNMEFQGFRIVWSVQVIARCVRPGMWCNSWSCLISAVICSLAWIRHLSIPWCPE